MSPLPPVLCSPPPQQHDFGKQLNGQPGQYSRLLLVKSTEHHRASWCLLLSCRCFLRGFCSQSCSVDLERAKVSRVTP